MKEGKGAFPNLKIFRVRHSVDYDNNSLARTKKSERKPNEQALSLQQNLRNQTDNNILLANKELKRKLLLSQVR